MKWQTIKKESEVKLEGVTVTFDVHNKQIVTVTLADKNGGVFRISEGKYSGIDILGPAAPVMVDRWKVAGSFLGFTDINELFENEYEANNRVSELKDKAGYPSDFAIKAEKVSIPEA